MPVLSFYMNVLNFYGSKSSPKCQTHEQAPRGVDPRCKALQTSTPYRCIRKQVRHSSIHIMIPNTSDPNFHHPAFFTCVPRLPRTTLRIRFEHRRDTNLCLLQQFPPLRRRIPSPVLQVIAFDVRYEFILDFVVLLNQITVFIQGQGSDLKFVFLIQECEVYLNSACFLEVYGTTSIVANGRRERGR